MKTFKINEIHSQENQQVHKGYWNFIIIVLSLRWKANRSSSKIHFITIKRKIQKKIGKVSFKSHLSSMQGGFRLKHFGFFFSLLMLEFYFQEFFAFFKFVNFLKFYWIKIISLEEKEKKLNYELSRFSYLIKKRLNWTCCNFSLGIKNANVIFCIELTDWYDSMDLNLWVWLI